MGVKALGQARLDAVGECLARSEHQVMDHLQNLRRVACLELLHVQVVCKVCFFQNALKFVEIVIKLANVVRFDFNVGGQDWSFVSSTAERQVPQVDVVLLKTNVGGGLRNVVRSDQDLLHVV